MPIDRKRISETYLPLLQTKLAEIKVIVHPYKIESDDILLDFGFTDDGPLCRENQSKTVTIYSNGQISTGRRLLNPMLDILNWWTNMVRNDLSLVGNTSTQADGMVK